MSGSEKNEIIDTIDTIDNKPPKGAAVMRALSRIMFALFLCVGIFDTARAQQSPEDILRTLNFRSGRITLGDNLADISLGQNYRFLNNADTRTFLTRLWGNPPEAAADALGMIIPTEPNLLGRDGWAIIVSYDPSGYVSDEDAKQIDYNELLGQMQKALRDGNKARVEKGFQAIELIGWAKKPYYDENAKKLFWAKRLRFGQSSEETLNYMIRVLGRRGVLDLDVVASMDALPAIDQRLNGILSMVEFNKGNTYAEFDSSVDKAAAYGLAGLIAGGILTKAGFFKGLLLLILGFKKAIAIGALAVVATFIGKLKSVLFGKKSG